jgi:hypothetical protein
MSMDYIVILFSFYLCWFFIMFIFLKSYCYLDDFIIQHVFRDENTVVNNLAQQASDFWSNRGKMYVLEKSYVPICHSGCSGLKPMHGAKICYAKPNLVKSDVPESEIRESGISRGLDDLVKQQ